MTPRKNGPGFGVTPRGQKAALVVDDDSSENNDYDDEYGHEEEYGDEEGLDDELFADYFSQ